MNYQKIYDQIIERAQSQNRIRLKIGHPDRIYYEKHHIIPKCMGGDNSKENLVLLTAREHFIVHWLLHRIHPENAKLAFSFWKMCFGNHNKKNLNVNLKISSLSFQEAREANSKFLSIINKSKNNAWKNKTEHSKISKEKIKKSNIDYWHNKRTSEEKITWNNSCSIRSKEQFKNMSKESILKWKNNIKKSYRNKTQDEKNEINKKRSLKLSKYSLLVYKYNDNSFVGKFESSGLACKALKIRNNISRFFLGYVNHVGGYTFQKI